MASALAMQLGESCGRYMCHAAVRPELVVVLPPDTKVPAFLLQRVKPLLRARFH